MLYQAFVSLESVERTGQVVVQLCLVEVGIVGTVQAFEGLYFFDEAVADVGGQVEIECGNGLSAVHFVLGGLQRDAAQDTGCLDALGRARFAVSGRETVSQDAVQWVLYARQALGGVVVLIVDVQVVALHGIQDLFVQQVVVYERFGGFAGKLHHHAGGGVGIHVGVLAGDVVGLDVDDLQEHVARLGFAGNAALVAISNVFLCHIFATALHQLQFYHVLDGFYGHLCCTAERNVIGDLVDELHVFAFIGVQHGFSDGSGNLLFVEADNAAVTLDNCLYHTV